MMLTTTMVENTITIQITTHTIPQLPREERRQIEVSIHLHAALLITIAFLVRLMIITKLLLVRRINSVIRKTERPNAIHVLNSESIAKNATLQMDALIVEMITGQ